jgi:hypothetical protein
MVAATAAALAVAAVPGVADANGGSGSAFPPGSSPYGRSYGEWSAKWWQWAYSTPAPHNPLLDETGADCGRGQSGKVFYLAGVLNVTGSATRNCDVPAGKALLFPIINAEQDNETCTPTDTTFTVKELRGLAKTVMDDATDLVATLDGVSLRTKSFRFTSPVFFMTMPADNLAKAVGCTDVTGGTYGPAVGDGYYIMLRPLSPGHHTLEFSGALPSFGFALHIVYHLDID